MDIVHIEKDFYQVVNKLGEYEIRNAQYFVKIDGVYYTWTDLGGTTRLAEWLYGKWILYTKCDEPFEEYVFNLLENGKILIRDYIQDNYELPPTCDNRTYTYLADKCAKTIGFGATWTQVIRFIEGELDYFATHPRGKDGKRGGYIE